MRPPINIFICHKKILTREKGGHSVEQENSKASILHAILQMHPDKYDPWIDESEITAGMKWEAEIYRRLLETDVLLLAVGPGTSGSEWVRREIALAKVLGVSIVPIGYDLTQDDLAKELGQLQVGELQGKTTQNIRFPAKDALLQELEGDLMRAREWTVQEQAKVLQALSSRRNAAKAKAKDDQKAFSVATSFGGGSVNIHVASGDLTKTSGVDVLVNSENDYMQMARFFETRTVSALLRSDRSRPVQAAEVFITSSGGPDSRLFTENKARYIFHVAAVQAIDAEARVVPFRQPDQIEDCVRSCLRMLAKLNQLQGVISPVGTRQRQLQERLAGTGDGISRSILFPLFGSGQGGGSSAEAIKHMLAGLRWHFRDPANVAAAADVEDIYFAGFTQPDVDAIIEELRRTFR